MDGWLEDRQTDSRHWFVTVTTQIYLNGMAWKIDYVL